MLMTRWCAGWVSSVLNAVAGKHSALGGRVPNRNARRKQWRHDGNLETFEARQVMTALVGAAPVAAVVSCVSNEADHPDEALHASSVVGTGDSEDFTAIGQKWQQPNGLGSAVTITYSYSNLLNGQFADGLSSIQIRAAIEEALALWAKYAPLNFVEVPDNGPTVSATDDDYAAGITPNIRIGHHEFDGGGLVIGHGYPPPPNGIGGIAGDIHFDDAEGWSVNPRSGTDLLETAVHEIGHALGLHHELRTSAVSAIMNPSLGNRYNGLGTAFLLPDDIAGIRTIYGTGTGSVNAPRMRIDDVTVTEGNSGTKLAVVTVTLSKASGTDTLVNYRTANTEAIAGSDYVAATGTLRIPAGQTTGTISIPINGDLTYELAESFRVHLSNPARAVLADDTAIVRINNDDAMPQIRIGDISVIEGDSGTRTAIVTVTLNRPSSVETVVNYKTLDSTAKAGSDYFSSAGTLRIPAGEVRGSIFISIKGDRVAEPIELFLVRLADARNGHISDDTAKVQIIDNDGSLPRAGELASTAMARSAALMTQVSPSGAETAASSSPMDHSVSTSKSAAAVSSSTAVKGTPARSATSTVETMNARDSAFASLSLTGLERL